MEKASGLASLKKKKKKKVIHSINLAGICYESNDI
jgi:hypothetical protein